MTVPVSESPDERNLRRLVDAINAINANAETANTSTSITATNGDNGGAKSTGTNGSSRSSRTLTNSKSPPKKGSRRHEDPAAARGIQRSPPRKGQQQQQQQQQQSQFSPKNGRSRARTNDDAAPRRARDGFSPAPPQTHLSRRATWTGSGGLEKDKEKDKRLPSSKGQEDGVEPARRVHLDSHFEGAAAAAATNATVTEMGVRGQAANEEEDVEDAGGRGVPWRERQIRGEGREPAGVGVSVGVGAGGERGAPTQGRPVRRQDTADGGKNFDARPGHGEEDEDSLPIEDRLRAVMEDLGVPSEGRQG